MSRAEVLAAVRGVLDRVVPHGGGVVLAVSGGPDSTALAYLVTEARPDLRACVGHVRHGLRDDAEDARVAAKHAEALGVRYHERHLHVEPADEGPEAAARRARYTALARVARTHGAGWVVTGHTADDQAETLLLNQARGTGLRGLAGMAEERAEGDVRIVRPLLRVRRADVRAFVAGEGLAFVEDPTNRDLSQPRARVRATVLEALAAGFGDVVGALSRLADLARADADALDELAADQARRLLVRWGPVRAVRSAELGGLPRALATRVLRLMLASVRGSSSGIPAETVAGILMLEPGQALHVPGGGWVTCGGGWIAGVPAGTAPLDERPLAVPGVTPLPELGMTLHADTPWGRPSDGRGQAQLDFGDFAVPTLRESLSPPPGPLADPLPRSVGHRTPAWAVLPAVGELRVRARRDGDRMRLRGGRRKLQDLLVDHGVPRAARDLVPIVVDVNDEPVWVPGVAVRAFDPDEPAALRLWLSQAAGWTLRYPRFHATEPPGA